MELTERELRLVSTSPDDSSVRLQLEWHSPEQLQNRAGTFNEAKLRELGFECPPPDPETRRAAETSRPAFIALELDPSVDDKIPSETVRTIVTSSDGRPPAPARVRSRLVVRDASRVYAPLRQRYPDTQRWLIVRGVIHPYLVTLADRESDIKRWEGRLTNVLPREIYVPLPHSRKLDPLKSQALLQRNYRVVLHYGRKLEPWVGSVEVTR
jgi:hypothetical protein